SGSIRPVPIDVDCAVQARLALRLSSVPIGDHAQRDTKGARSAGDWQLFVPLLMMFKDDSKSCNDSRWDGRYPECTNNCTSKTIAPRYPGSQRATAPGDGDRLRLPLRPIE